MFLASTDTQVFGEIATVLFMNLESHSDYIYIRRKKCFSTRTDLPGFMVLVYGRNGKQANSIFIEKTKWPPRNDGENIKNLIFAEVTHNLPKICGRTVQHLNESHCQYLYLNPKKFIYDSHRPDNKFILPNIGVYEEAGKSFVFLKKFEKNVHSLGYAVISNLISIKYDELFNGNLQKVLFRQMKLKDLISLEEIETIPSYWKSRRAKQYTAIKLWELARSCKRDLGLFIVRDVDFETFCRRLPNRSLAEENLKNVGKGTRFLVSGTVDFSEVCQKWESIHEVAYESSYCLLYWLRSSKNTNTLQEFVLKADIDDASIDPIENPIKFICGASGAGKSLYLNKLQKELKEEDKARWIEIADGKFWEYFLKENHNILEIPLIQVLKKLFKVSNEWENCIFNYCVKIPGRLTILLDNIDDLGKVHFKTCALFIRQINTEYSNIAVWISGRETFKNILLEYIPIMPFYLPEFDKEEQLCLLNSLLSECKGVNTEEVLDKLSEENSPDFKSSPYCLLLASKKIQQNGMNTSLYCLDIFDFYVDWKVRNFSKNINLERLYSSAAFTIFNSEIDIAVDIKEDLVFYEVFGKYQERIIAEYLTGCYLSKNSKIVSENDVYFKNSLFRTMEFFDRIQFRDSKVGSAVINGNFEQTILLSETEDLIAAKDSLNRNFAHIVKDEHAGILVYLLEKGVSLRRVDKMLNTTVETYMDEREAYNCIEILLKHGCEAEKFKKLLSCEHSDLCTFFEDQLHQRHFLICKLLLEKRVDLKITPSIIYRITSDLDDYPKVLVMQVLNLAKKQKLKEPEYTDYLGETAVHNTVRDPNGLDIIKVLFEDLHYDIDREDYTGTTPILLVSSVDTLDYLVKNGADPFRHHCECNLRTLFHTACMNGDLDIVKYYIEVLVADIKELRQSEISPLYYAAMSGSLEVISYLFENGFTNVNETNIVNGDTPLHAACQGGFLHIVQYLVKHGADVNIESNHNKLRPIDVIAPGHNVNILKIYNLLIENGSIFNTDHLFNLLKTESFECFQNACKKMQVDWDQRDTNGDTLLHYSAKYVNNSHILEFIGRNSNLELYNEDEGVTPLHLAFSVGSKEAIKVLIKLGADLHKKSKNGRNMFHFAVMTPRRDSFELLFQNNIKINDKDKEGKSTVHYYASAGDPSLSSLLLEKGMNVNIQDDEGMTALHEICKNNFYFAKDSTEFCLRDLRIDANLRDNRGRTALHYAIENDNLQVAKIFSKYQKVDVTAVDEDDESPLSLADKITNKNILTFLCEIQLKQSLQDD